MIVSFTALIDRYLPAITLDTIKSDVGLSDTGISLIQGLAFSIFYCFSAIPLGRMVDHYNRRNLLLFAAAIWTILTIWSGLAQSFEELFIARAGVGITEAVLAPAAYSMIGDCFHPRTRGRAIGIYFASLIAGSGGSFIIGGTLLAYFSDHPMNLPIIGVLGVPALLAGLTLKEPKRRQLLNRVQHSLLPFLRSNSLALIAIFFTLTWLGVSSGIAVVWAPTLYSRAYGVESSDAATIVGLAILAGGLIGSLTTGWFSDRWNRRTSGMGRFRVQMTSLLLSVPLLALWPLVPWMAISYVLLALGTVASTFGMASNAATIQDIVPNQLRGQVIAIMQILLLLATGLAPTMVGLVTDYGFEDPASLPMAIALVGMSSALLGAIVSLGAARKYAGMRLAANADGT
jgi:MFS family permease